MTQPTSNGPTPGGPSTGELRALRMTAQRLAGLIGDGDTAAVAAALADQPRLVGIAVERDGQDGWTPLHLAVLGGSRELVEVVAGAGADLTARTEHGRTPLQVAIESAPDLVPVLQSLGAPVDAASAAFTGDTGRLTTELDAGTPLTDTGSGVDLLSWAAFGGRLEAVRLLLDRGADADGGALRVAAGALHAEVAEVLLGAGAGVDRRDPETGRTALHAAVAAGADDRATAVVGRLLDAGADPDATTADGASAIDIAQVAAARGRPGADGGATPFDGLLGLLEEHRTRR